MTAAALSRKNPNGFSPGCAGPAGTGLELLPGGGGTGCAGGGLGEGCAGGLGVEGRGAAAGCSGDCGLGAGFVEDPPSCTGGDAAGRGADEGTPSTLMS